MKARVLLIDPPFQVFFEQSHNQFPLGLGYLAASLEKNGIETLILNADYSPTIKSVVSEKQMIDKYEDYINAIKTHDHPSFKEIRAIIEDYNPTIVGVTVRTPKYMSALIVASVVKSVNKNISVVFGGVHPTLLPEIVIKNENVDFVVRGEGEITIVELVKGLVNDIENVKSITYKRNDTIIHNPDRELIHDMDSIPFPARHLMIKKTDDPNYYNIIFATRGCPHNCTFCASKNIWTRQVRFRSPKNVVDEIEFVKNKYKCNIFNFIDDSFVVNPKYTIQICDEINRRKLKIKWVCETPASSVTDDLIKQMKAAGCYSLMFGVESGNAEILKKVNKSSTKEEMILAAALVKKYKLRLTCAFMIGFPWDTRDTIRETVEFMKELDPDLAGISITIPYPGTELYNTYIEEGCFNKEEDIDYTYFNQINPRMFNRNIEEEDQIKIVANIVKIFNNHNRLKLIKGLFNNPRLYFNLLIGNKNIGVKLLINMLRYLIR
ncbi:B12-binding domain-containing radical SAM protein [Candidatus Magnetominusculus xianensis]|uniref:B12-binding domain-containing radical SAM protein n=1 Tax=Candidatus Magnetominusculus xianensis TaxID=1748249 RepID=A0ABR5SHB0_9BACT|nr:radical SAM protein [Candidatus Magnetominusculus xianensis]KWT82524.1 B12-binding domain-containing radical SAM protein [Candidatus Magnetominusculus xianensis]MBF0405525.1 radical SAM protein [Nitrospirota bacterium]